MNNDQIQLSTNSIKEYLDGKTDTKATLQITNLKRIEDKQSDENNSFCYRVTISDGINTHSSCILNSSLNGLVDSGDLKENTIIRIKEIMVDFLDDQTNRTMLIINDIDIIQTNAHEIIYYSKDVEKSQTINNRKILQPIRTFPTTTKKPNASVRSSLTNNHANETNDQLTTSRSENEKLISISQINPYINKWYIKGVVTNKANIHHYNNAHGEGSVFSFDFLDDTDEIRVTLFNNDCIRFHSTIHIGEAYYIANAIVKPVNRQYNKLSSNYEIYVTRDTIINNCSMDNHSHASKSQHDYVLLCDVEKQSTNAVIDVIGIINTVFDPCIVTNNTDHKSYVKRIIHLIDETGSIPVTLWQDQATNFDDNNKSVLAFEGIKVHDFNGRRSLSTTPTTYLKYNPIDTERTEKLKLWFKNNSENATNYIHFNTIETFIQQTSPKTLVQAIMEYAADHSRAIYFSVKATCTYIDKNNLIYRMCPTDGCAKKVVENDQKEYYCTKCCVSHQSFKWGYKTTIQISDSTASQSIIFFNKQTEILTHTPATEIANYLINNDDAMIDTILGNIIDHEYIFKISVQKDQYKNQMSMIMDRIAMKISNFFHNDEQRSLQKRSVNAISPPTPIKSNVTVNNIDSKTIIGTCQSLKKMKINESNQQDQIDNYQLNMVFDNDTDEIHSTQSDQVHHASLLSLSSSSITSHDGSPMSNSENIQNDETSNDQNINYIQENSALLADVITLSTALPTFVSVATQTVSECTLDTFTQTTDDLCFPLETHTVTSTTNIEDIITDEDIIKYLTRKKLKES